MSKKKENILAAIIFIGFISHYCFGYFFWKELGSEKIYSITMYFCADIWGLVLFLLACGRILKGLGVLGMVLGTFFFYMEFQDPYNWEVVDYRNLATLTLSSINLFFVLYYTDVFKKLKKP